MPASTAVITDLTTVTTTAPTAATKAAAQNPALKIQDPVGNAKLCLLKAQEIKFLLGEIKNVTDASDPNLTTINNLLLVLV